MVYGHSFQGTTPTRGLEHHSRRRVEDHEGSLGLDAVPHGVPTNQSEAGTSKDGPVCQQVETSAATVCQLETRPDGCSHRRLHNELEGVQGICKPYLEPDQGK